MSLSRFVLACHLACLAALCVPAAGIAAPVLWTLSNDVGLESDGNVQGYFVYDSDTGTFGDRWIVVYGGDEAAFPMIHYGAANSTAVVNPDLGNPQPTLVFTILGRSRQLRLTPKTSLGNAGGLVELNTQTPGDLGSVECFLPCSSGRKIYSGALSGAPAVADFAITSAMSGNWYDPSQNGHGLQVEVLPGGAATAIWFTFDKDGHAAWVSGAGTVQGSRVVMSAVRVLNGRFPPHYTAATVERRPWGTLVLSFSDCNHGRVEWHSSDSAFTADGAMPLQRLTAIAGLACP